MEYFQFHNNNKMGIKSLDRIIIPAVYDYIEPLSDRLFLVQNNGKTAYFDESGKEFLPFDEKYDEYLSFREGFAGVFKNSKWGFIDKDGKEVIDLKFHGVDYFFEGFAIVFDDQNLYGAIDRTGNLVIDYQFRFLLPFENGYAKFCDHETWGLIDTKGRIVVEQKYIFIGSVEGGKVIVQTMEDEQYREGILTIGSDIEWNDNLEYLNEFNRVQKEFISACEKLMEYYYAEGCPCQFKRFRNFIEWNNTDRFIDQENLYAVFQKRLNPVEDEDWNTKFSCPVCGTIYNEDWKQLSAYFIVLNVKIYKLGVLIERGAEVPDKIPVVLGFQGYEIDGMKEFYFQADVVDVINYLKE